MSTVGTQDKIMKSLISDSLFHAILYIIKLSLDCLIHGSVYEVTQVLGIEIIQNKIYSVRFFINFAIYYATD
jgi:hypothetical protein